MVLLFYLKNFEIFSDIGFFLSKENKSELVFLVNLENEPNEFALSISIWVETSRLSNNNSKLSFILESLVLSSEIEF
jgi:hypothetical protein